MKLYILVKYFLPKNIIVKKIDIAIKIKPK